MLHFAATVSTADDDGPGRYIFLAVGLAIAATVTAAVYRRRDRKSTAAATGGSADTLAFVIVPASPLAEHIAQVRTVLGETEPPTAFTRYARPVVTVNESELVISDKKFGVLATIPLTAIARVDARAEKVRPKGVVYPRTFQAVGVTVAHGGAETRMVLAPVVGAYESVTAAEAGALASAMASRIGAARPATPSAGGSAGVPSTP